MLPLTYTWPARSHILGPGIHKNVSCSRRSQFRVWSMLASQVLLFLVLNSTRPRGTEVAPLWGLGVEGLGFRGVGVWSSRV